MNIEEIKNEFRQHDYNDLKELYRSLKGFLKAKKIGKKGIDANIKLMNKARLKKMKEKKLGLAFKDNISK